MHASADLKSMSPKLKVVLLGNTKSGKTSLLNRWIHDTFDADTPPTIGVDFKIKTYQSDEEGDKKFQIWDVSGQDRFSSLVSIYTPDAKLFVLIFDVTDRDSFDALKSKWYPIIRSQSASESVPVIILGNKIDLTDRRKVSPEEAADFAKELGAVYIETSAKNNVGLELLQATMLGKPPSQSTSSSVNQLQTKIDAFKREWSDNETMQAIATILEVGINATPMNRQEYFDSVLPGLQTHLKTLRWNSASVCNTAVNFIVTVLLALSIVGLPMAYFSGLLNKNAQTTGHSLMFFAFGEKQQAQSLCHDIITRSQTTLPCA